MPISPSRKPLLAINKRKKEGTNPALYSAPQSHKNKHFLGKNYDKPSINFASETSNRHSIDVSIKSTEESGSPRGLASKQ